MLPIKTKDDLYTLNPDFKALAEYTKINKVGACMHLRSTQKKG